MARNWTRDELIVAMNLYCQLPFGKYHSRNPQVIQLAGLIDRTPSSVAMKLSNLASLDPYHAERGVKGLSGASNADRRIWEEFHADWETLAAESESLLQEKTTSTGDQTSPNVEGSTTTMRQPPPAAFSGETETRRATKVRLAQGFFRKTVLASYNDSCCVTGLSISTLLVASHILPWSTHPEERINPRNGLCLNSLFDRAFDRGLMTFDDEYRLVLSVELTGVASKDAIRQHFQPYEGISMHLPTKFLPSAAHLANHRESCFLG